MNSDPSLCGDVAHFQVLATCCFVIVNVKEKEENLVTPSAHSISLFFTQTDTN